MTYDSSFGQLAMDLGHLALANAGIATIMALAIFCVTRFIRNPHVTHFLWCLVLIKLVTPPLFTLSIPIPQLPSFAHSSTDDHALEHADFPQQIETPRLAVETPDEAETVASQKPTPTPSEPAIPTTIEEFPKLEPSDLDPFLQQPTVIETPEPLPPPPVQTIDSAPQFIADNPPETAPESSTQSDNRNTPYIWLMMGLLVLWAVGSAITAIVVVRRIVTFNRLLNRSLTVSESLDETVIRVASQMKLKRPATARLIESEVGPLVWAGCRQPLIVIPKSLWTQLESAEQETLIAHELAHVKRKDHWFRRCEIVLITLYWWLPTLWWAIRQRSDAAESACDALVLGVCPAWHVPYANALYRALEFQSQPQSSLLSHGLGHVSQLKSRLTMIAHNATPRRLRPIERLGLFGLSLALLGFSANWVDAQQDQPLEDSANAPIETPQTDRETPFQSDDIDDPFAESDPFGQEQTSTTEITNQPSDNPLADSEPPVSESNNDPFAAVLDAPSAATPDPFPVDNPFGAASSVSTVKEDQPADASSDDPFADVRSGPEPEGNVNPFGARSRQTLKPTPPSSISENVRQKMAERLIEVVLNEEESVDVRMSAIQSMQAIGLEPTLPKEKRAQLVDSLWLLFHETDGHESAEGRDKKVLITNNLVLLQGYPRNAKDIVALANFLQFEAYIGPGGMGEVTQIWGAPPAATLIFRSTRQPNGIKNLIAAIKSAPDTQNPNIPDGGRDYMGMGMEGGMGMGGEVGMMGSTGPAMMHSPALPPGLSLNEAQRPPKRILLTFLAKTTPQNDEMLEALLTAIGDENSDIRAAAIQAIGNVKKAGDPADAHPREMRS